MSVAPLAEDALRCDSGADVDKRVLYVPDEDSANVAVGGPCVEDSAEKARRFQGEIERMRTKWEKLLKKGDPLYNKNLSLSKWNYSLRAGAKME